MEYAIGIDLGGTQIKFIVTDASGNILEQTRCNTGDRVGHAGLWTDRIQAEVGRIEQSRGGQARWMGVAAPGMASRDKRTIISLPGRLNGLENLDWTQFFNKQELVAVINDAHAAYYGEAWQGAARDYKDVILLTLGTGVGGAFSINGQLQEGVLGRAGHFGHTCLNPDAPLDIKNSPGSIENMIGECAVETRTNGRFKQTKDLVQAHLEGDKEATELWHRSIYCLACALSSFINILDPEVILIGGGISKAGHALLEPLSKYMNRVEWRPEGQRVDIKLATLGNKAGALGAIRYAMLTSKQSSLENKFDKAVASN